MLSAQTSTECTFQWNAQAQIVKYATAMTVIEASLFLSLFTPHIKEKFHSSNKKKFNRFRTNGENDSRKNVREQKKKKNRL